MRASPECVHHCDDDCYADQADAGKNAETRSGLDVLITLCMHFRAAPNPVEYCVNRRKVSTA
jgi:hypothetical protein